MKKLCAISTLLVVLTGVILFFGCSSTGPLELIELSSSSDDIGYLCNFEPCPSSDSDGTGEGGESSSSYGGYSSPYETSSNSDNPGYSSSIGGTTSSSGTTPAASSSSVGNITPSSARSSSSVYVPTNNCAYQTSLCGGIAFDDIITTSFNNASLDEGPNCLFATQITKLGNENGQGGGLRVNGVELKGNNNAGVGGRCGNTDWGQQTCASAIANVPKIDGGYYVYAPAWAGDITTTGGNPNCNGGVRPSSSSAQVTPQSSSSRPSSSSAGQVLQSSASVDGTLTCGNVPSSGTAGQAVTAPTVNCNGNIVTGANITWSGTPNAPSWTNPSTGTYNNIRARVNSNASGTAQACRDKEAICSGTLTVSNPPPPSSAYQPSSASTGGGSCETCVPSGQLNQTGRTTRYWDGCKPSCAWPGKQTNGQGTAKTCNISGGTLSDANAQSACGGGPAFTCMNQAPWSISDNIAYGFAASHTDADCGKCFQLEFTSNGEGGTAGSVSVIGKTLVVMISNIGGDVSGNQFDLMIPGGGVGQFDAISRQITSNGGSSSNLGAQYGGFRATCGNSESCVQGMCNSAFGGSGLSDMKRGCDWYVSWMKIANNPTVKFKDIPCPAALKAKW